MDSKLRQALDFLQVFGQGARTLPYVEGVEPEKRRARKAPSLAQWTISRPDFPHKVLEEYSKLSSGEPRLIIAGTGVGKSTKLPCTIAYGKSVSGMIVFPNEGIAAAVYKYSKSAMPEQFPGLSFGMFRTGHLTKPMTTPALYYTSGENFLAKLAVCPSLTKDMSLDFIALDEAHECTAAYHFMRILVGIDYFPGVKVFYSSATYASDMNQESGNTLRTQLTVDPSLLEVVEPEKIPSRSPLHHDSINTKSLIFVPTNKDVRAMAKYYDDHDIASYAAPMTASTRSQREMEQFLLDNKVGVVVTTQQYETGVTFTLRYVVDTGRTVNMVIDFQSATLSFDVLNATGIQRVQRMGRGGRFLPAKTYHSTAPAAASSFGLTAYEAFLVYLWCVAYNIEIKEESIARYAMLVPGVTRLQAAILLNARIPAYLLLPYVVSDGVYSGCASVLKFAFYSDYVPTSSTRDFPEYDKWSDRLLPAGVLDENTHAYKSSIQYPDDLAVIPYYMYKIVSGAMSITRNLFDNVSVASLALTDAVTSGHARAPESVVGESVRSVETAKRRAKSKRSIYTDVGSVRESTYKGDFVPVDSDEGSLPAYEPLAEGSSEQAPIFDDEKVYVKPKKNVRIKEQSSAHSVEDWVESIHQSSSTSSESQKLLTTLQLREVTAEDHIQDKLYPMDPDMLEAYHENSHVVDGDKTRVRDLVTGKKNFSALEVTRRENLRAKHEYFLSTLRTHNHALVGYLQYLSDKSEKPFFSRDTKKHKYVSTLQSTCYLLRAMRLEGYKVGVEKRTKRAGDSVLFPLHAAVFQAKFALDQTSVGVRDSIVESMMSAKVFLVDEKLNGVYWEMGDLILSVRHVALPSDTGGENQPLVLPKDDASLVCDSIPYDFAVWRAVNTTNTVIKTRMPIAGEHVTLCGFSSKHAAPTAFALGRVFGEKDVWIVNLEMPSGFSGAGIFSLDDGCLLGLYVGVATTLDTGVVSRIVPIDLMVDQIDFSF